MEDADQLRQKEEALAQCSRMAEWMDAADAAADAATEAAPAPASPIAPPAVPSATMDVSGGGGGGARGPSAAPPAAAAAAAAVSPPPAAAAAAAADAPAAAADGGDDDEAGAPYVATAADWRLNGKLGPKETFGAAYRHALGQSTVLAPSGTSFGVDGLEMPTLGRRPWHGPAETRRHQRGGDDVGAAHAGHNPRADIRPHKGVHMCDREPRAL
jgi:hypothetical protein